MTEHEKLVEICDLIEYDIKYNYDGDIYDTEFHNINGARIVDVREVIFTQEFMKKLTIQLEKKMGSEMFKRGLLDNLDNPVQYLYNTLGLGNQ